MKNISEIAFCTVTLVLPLLGFGEVYADKHKTCTKHLNSSLKYQSQIFLTIPKIQTFQNETKD
jgi:hypothetical protein